MNRTLVGMVVGAGIVALGTWGVTTWQDMDHATRIAEVQSEPLDNWIVLSGFHIDDAALGSEPMLSVTIEVKRKLMIRITTQPRNATSGDPVCQGRTLTVLYEPRPATTRRLALATLAGLPSCTWEPGRYTASITLSLTDPETNVALKPIALESNVFTVAGH